MTPRKVPYVGRKMVQNLLGLCQFFLFFSFSSVLTALVNSAAGRAFVRLRVEIFRESDTKYLHHKTLRCLRSPIFKIDARPEALIMRAKRISVALS